MYMYMLLYGELIFMPYQGIYLSLDGPELHRHALGRVVGELESGGLSWSSTAPSFCDRRSFVSRGGPGAGRRVRDRGQAAMKGGTVRMQGVQRKPLLSIMVRTEPDIVFARQRARQLATLLGLAAPVQVALATAVSEIVRNAVL